MKNKKVLLFVGIILILIILNHMFGWSSYFESDKVVALLSEMVAENLALAILTYIVFTVIGCVVLALPGLTFAIIAGVLFGPIWGTLCCALATTIGAMIAFLAGRFFLKDSVKPMLEKNKYLKKWLLDESGKNEIFVLMITRLVPLFPFNLQNFAYGITEVKFSVYSVFSLIFMLPGTAMYTIGAAGLVDAENRILYIGIAIALAIAVIGAGVFLKKHYVQEAENDK